MRVLAACILVLSTISCATDSTSLGATELASLGIINGRTPFPGVVTGGQLTEGQFSELSALGYELVSLRPDSEDGAAWEEPYAAAHGASFHRIPVAGADGVTVENARRLAEILLAAEDHGAVVYCKSGNRVGALFALKAHFLDGMSPEESLRIGQEAGLTRLEPHVRSLLGL